MLALRERLEAALLRVTPVSGQAGSAASASFDPERALWLPGRRSFLFLMGAALAGTVIGRALPQEEMLFGFPLRYVAPPRGQFALHVEEMARAFGVPEHIIAEANPGLVP